MPVMHAIQTWTIPNPKIRRYRFKRLECPQEDAELTPEQKAGFLVRIVQDGLIPILRGDCSIREVIIPAGGWARYDEEHSESHTMLVGVQIQNLLRWQ